MVSLDLHFNGLQLIKMAFKLRPVVVKPMLQ